MIAKKHLNFMKVFGKYNEILEIALNGSLNFEAKNSSATEMHNSLSRFVLKHC